VMAPLSEKTDLYVSCVLKMDTHVLYHKIGTKGSFMDLPSAWLH